MATETTDDVQLALVDNETDDNKQNITANDGENKEAEEEEVNGLPSDYHPPSKGDDVMKTVLTPFFINYWFILVITLAASSVGFIVYVVIDLWWVICIFAGAGFIGSSCYEGFRYYKDKQMKRKMDAEIDAKENDHFQDDDELEEGMTEWKEDPDEDGVYVETEFDNAYIETIEDGKKTKKKRKRKTRITGSTRAYIKRGAGCLVVEKRALYMFQDYKGYEIGGGLSSLAGFSITIATQIIKRAVSAGTDDEVDVAGNIAILLFITLALLCLGCIIEIELRKKQILAPNKLLYLTATSIGLHEIQSVDRHSTTNYQNVSSELDEKGGGGLLMKKIAIKWFYCLLGIFKLCQWIIMAVTINTAIVMFIFTTIIFGLLYDLSVNKSNSSLAPESTVTIMIFTWIAVAIGIFGLLYLSQAIVPGKKEYYRLSLENRIPKPQQLKLWILILVATILLTAVAIMITVLDADVYKRNAEDVDIEGPETSSRITHQMLCISVEEDTDNSGFSGGGGSTDTTPAPSFRRRMQFDYQNVYVNEPFCYDAREYTVFVALILTLIAWWILLFGAYFWRQHDQGIFRFDLTKNKKMRRVWRRYSVINIGLKTQKKSSFFSGGSKAITIELDPAEAIKLHDYLNSVVPWFQVDHCVNSSIVYKKKIN